MLANLPSSSGEAADNPPFAMPAFLRLPRELRDLIYDYYFRCEDGYIYNFKTNRLTQADGQPIPLSLILICRQIQVEVQELALGMNTIVFTTAFTEDTRDDAALYHTASKCVEHRKLALLNQLAPLLLDATMTDTAATLYPQFRPMLHILRTHGVSWQDVSDNLHWGEAPSTWRDFVTYTLALVSKNPKFVETSHVRTRMYPACKGNMALELLNAWPEPWTIPDTLELEELIRIVQRGPHIPFYSPETKYAYSAGSVAVRFLRSISPKARAALRYIHIYEDHKSVAFPECHGRGFISFCQENPELRVTRIVSLWKNVFPVSGHSQTTYTDGNRSFLERLSNDRLPAEGITKSVGTWVMEALALPSLGMPKGSYTLVLDGNPTPEHTSEIFRVVQRDVVWQAALDLAYSRGLLPEPSWQDRRRRKGYMYEGLPDVVRSLSRNSPLVRTNFDLGPVYEYDTESLLEERRAWSLQDWEERWATHEPHEFQTASPLPPWHILRWGHVIL